MAEDYMNMFNDMLGKFRNNNLDIKYKEAKKKSNLKLFKMKSGKFKIMDYYENLVSEHNDITSAKKAFCKIANIEI